MVSVFVALVCVIVVLELKVIAPAPRFKLKLPVKVKLFIVITGAGDKVMAEVASIVVPAAIVKVPGIPPFPPKAAAFPIFRVPAL